MKHRYYTDLRKKSITVIYRNKILIKHYKGNDKESDDHFRLIIEFPVVDGRVGYISKAKGHGKVTDLNPHLPKSHWVLWTVLQFM